MSLTLIVAASENNIIGNKGDLPWDIPEDRRRFRNLTFGHPVIQGRKTYESIVKRLGNPLSGRQNIVISSGELNDERVIVAHYVGEALALAQKFDRDVYVIGGESVYIKFFNLADRIDLTRVHKDVGGDAYFPEIKDEEWKEVRREEREGFSFLTYTRK